MYKYGISDRKYLFTLILGIFLNTLNTLNIQGESLKTTLK